MSSAVAGLDWRAWAVIALAAAAVLAALLHARKVIAGGEPTSVGETTRVSPTQAHADGGYLGFHYRTNSRFGDFVRLAVKDGQVTVTGARLPVGGYWFFIGSQAVLLALVPVVLVAAAVYLSWQLALLAVGMLVVHGVYGGVLAGGLWSLMGMMACQPPGAYVRSTFPLSAVRGIRLGKGWARNGLGMVILPYLGGIDSMAIGRGISFEAPDPETGRYAVYTFHAYTEEEAAEVMRLLSGEGSSAVAAG